MSVRQLSVFVENQTGHLANVLGTLADGGVNVFAFTIADTSDYGILRLIVDDADRATDLLTGGEYSVVEHPVVCARIPHKPGALAALVRFVSGSGLDIEYVYLGARDSIILKVDGIEELETLLGEGGIAIIGPEDLA